ncbi:hypothetical protein BH11PLA2_BH11PLA2_48840 [soil metagenome]
MFFFDYLRLKARDAVLAGVQDALDQIDPALAGQVAPPAVGPPLPQLGAADSGPAETGGTPPAPTTTPPTPPAPGGSLQERLAQATTTLGPNSTALTPPKPSSPKRGRGRPDDGGPA